MRGERMSLYAQVIVDVPTMQTNKPYTYLVPSELEEQIQAGMRCVVPFGKGSRKIQGFVLDVSNQKPDEDFEIKKIISLMDFAQSINFPPDFCVHLFVKSQKVVLIK